MTPADFEILVARRDDVQRQHARACETLERQGPPFAHANHRQCARLYGALEAAQREVDAAHAALAARRAG
jgi:hypothetical protein